MRDQGKGDRKGVNMRKTLRNGMIVLVTGAFLGGCAQIEPWGQSETGLSVEAQWALGILGALAIWKATEHHDDGGSPPPS